MVDCFGRYKPAYLTKSILTDNGRFVSIGLFLVKIRFSKFKPKLNWNSRKVVGIFIMFSEMTENKRKREA